MLHIDKHPRAAVIFLLRTIAHHQRLADEAAERRREVGARYHEASIKDAEEALAFYERYWPEETAAGRVQYALAGAASQPHHREDLSEARADRKQATAGQLAK